MPDRPATPRSTWLDDLLAERQVYVRGRGQPYFITISRRARLLRLGVLVVVLVALAGLGGAFAVGLERHRALEQELAALRAEGGARTAEEAELDRLRAEIEAERTGRSQLEAELEQERAARAVAGRAGDAELEAATARIALLSSQLASAEQAKERALSERETARAQAELAVEAELAALRTELAAAGGGRSSEDAGVVLAERDALRARVAALEQERLAQAEALAGAVAEGERLRTELARLAEERDAARARLDAALAAAAIAEAKGPPPAPAAAPLLGELQAELTAMRQRNAALEAHIGRQAPSPPAAAPRR